MTAPATTSTDEVQRSAQGVLLRRIVTYAPSSLLPAVLTLVTSMVFTRLFTPAAFGVYSLFLVVAGPVKLVFTTWVSQAMGKFVPPEQTDDGRRDARDAAFVAIALVFCCEALLGLAAVALLGPRLGPQDRGFLVAMVAFVVVSSVFELVTVLLAVEHRAGDYSVFRVGDAVLTFALRLLLVSAVVRMDLTLMFWSVVVSNAVLLPLLWRRALLPSPRGWVALARSEGTRRRVRAFAVFGLPMTIWFFSAVLLDVGDRFVINHFLGPAAVGVYDANYRLVAGSAVLLVVPITITLHPYLMSISGSGDTERIGRVIATVVENLALVGLLAVGIVAVFSRDIAALLLGPEFREGHVIMALVLAGVLFNNIGTFTQKPFEIAGRTRPMVVASLCAAAANIAFNLALVPSFGYLGSAWATLLAYVLYSVWIGAGGRRLVPWRVDVRRVAGYVAVIALGLVGVGLLRTRLDGLPDWAGLVAAVLASGVLAAWCTAGLLRGVPVTRAWTR